MILELCILAIGIILLYKGADWLIDGASSVALLLRISPVIIALTIIAYGTSLPETSVSVVASAQGKGSIAVGNIVGSNIANILLALGVALIIRPAKIEGRRGISADALLVLIISTVFFMLCVDGQLTRGDGIILLLFFIGYICFYIRHALIQREKNKNVKIKKKWNMGPAIVLIGVGLVGVIIGAEFLVRAGVSIAGEFGIAPEIIGLSLLAFGTSVPELATSVMAMHKGEAEISIGNVMGSNVFNIALVGGIIALMGNVFITGKFLVIVALMILVTSTLLPLMSKKRLGRALGVGMLVAYFFYIAFIFIW